MFSSWIPVARRLYSTGPARSYLVTRTTNNSIPVYSDIKNGRTRKLTIIRRIKGDANALRDDLMSSIFAEAAKDAVKVKPITNQIEIKGHHVEEVKEWLILQGF